MTFAEKRRRRRSHRFTRRQSAVSRMRRRPNALDGAGARRSSTARICALSIPSSLRARASWEREFCDGELLAELKPSLGVGVDLSASRHRGGAACLPCYRSTRLRSIEAPGFIKSFPGPFDFIVIVDTLGSLDDCQFMFENLHSVCTRETRLIVGYFWRWSTRCSNAPRRPSGGQQPPRETSSRGFRRGRACGAGRLRRAESEKRLLLPLRLFGLGRLVNRFIAPFRFQ